MDNIKVQISRTESKGTDLQSLKSELNSQMNLLHSHDLYSNIKSISDLRKFMEIHVFCVWDFMSLTKSLQRYLTCVDIPWVPRENSKVVRFINEVVLAEESDQVDDIVSSHFELYLLAMDEVGANSSSIRQIVDQVRNGLSLEIALEKSGVSDQIRDFVLFNINVAKSDPIESLLGNFIYGREDSIPEMFSSLLSCWGIEKKDAPLLYKYLERHIELDGEEHGPMILEVSKSIVSDEQGYTTFFQGGLDAVNSRIKLWNYSLRRLKRL